MLNEGINITQLSFTVVLSTGYVPVRWQRERCVGVESIKTDVIFHESFGNLQTRLNSFSMNVHESELLWERCFEFMRPWTFKFYAPGMVDLLKTGIHSVNYRCKLLANVIPNCTYFSFLSISLLSCYFIIFNTETYIMSIFVIFPVT